MEERRKHMKNVNSTPNSHLVAEKSTLKFSYLPVISKDTSPGANLTKVIALWSNLIFTIY